jgi:hypothetical protein
MSSKSLLLLSRKVHLYFGLFISPALLFFAFTGAYQTLGLHEAASNYKPPALLAELGQVHKKQTTVMPVRRGPGLEAGPAGASRPEGGQATGTAGHAPGEHARDAQPDTRGTDGHRGKDAPRATAEGTGAGSGRGPQPPQTLQAKERQHLPLKIFFVVVSLGLLTSTLTGIYMACKYDRNKVLVTALLLAGAVIPLVLLRL